MARCNVRVRGHVCGADRSSHGERDGVGWDEDYLMFVCRAAMFVGLIGVVMVREMGWDGMRWDG
jgi:hypothetical protein